MRDDQSVTLYAQVGGASVEDDVGALVGLHLKRKSMGLKKRITPSSKGCRSPIVAGVLVKKHDALFLSLHNGEIAIFDLEKNEFTRTIAKPPGRFEITHMVADEKQDGLWMAFRRDDGKINNWCFQEYFKLPNVEPVPGAFTG